MTSRRLSSSTSLDPLESSLGYQYTYTRFEKLYGANLNKARKEDPQVESSKKTFQEKKNEGKPAREGKGHVGHLVKYTPLVVSMEKYLLRSLLLT